VVSQRLRSIGLDKLVSFTVWILRNFNRAHSATYHNTVIFKINNLWEMYKCVLLTGLNNWIAQVQGGGVSTTNWTETNNVLCIYINKFHFQQNALCCFTIQITQCLVLKIGRPRLKCDGTCTKTRFRLSAKRTSPFKSAAASVQSILAAEVCASALVMLDALCSEVVWRVLDTHSIHQFPLHFPSRAGKSRFWFPMVPLEFSLT
jgi:hypothetical protein